MPIFIISFIITIHVVIMGAILSVVLGMFKVSSVHWGLFLGPLLCMYTFATGMQSSAVRACIMAIIYWGAPLLGRKADGLTALFVSVLVIVAAVPTQLYDTGFILSVVCVLGSIVLYPLIHKPIQIRERSVVDDLCMVWVAGGLGGVEARAGKCRIQNAECRLQKDRRS